MNPSDSEESDFENYAEVIALCEENAALRQRIHELERQVEAAHEHADGMWRNPDAPLLHHSKEAPDCPHFVVHDMEMGKLYFELALWRSKTVRNLKEEICKMTGLPVNLQMLIFNWHRMTEMDHTLADYGIVHGSRIDVTMSANWGN